LEYTSTHPLFILMREILNADTRQKIAERAQL
ncbi:phosphohydrolase, partial [Salmonella enterica]|nr:phosphohydrolase [Salmonella enterica]